MDPTPLSPSPNFIFKFDFEDRFPIKSAEKWMQANYHYCLHVAGTYLVVVFSLKRFMSHRRPRDLRMAQFVWNVILALLTLCAAVRLFEETLYGLTNFGLRHVFCSPCFLTETPTTALWTYVCFGSRILELGDTVFIVLRKKKLLFLHLFHHSLVVVIFSVGLRDVTGPMRPANLVNLIIHIPMYTYYAIRSLNYKVPQIIAKLITGVQTLQMIGGVLFSPLIVWWILDEQGCAVSDRAFLIGNFFYFVNMLLFIDYFKSTYLTPKVQGTKVE